MSRVAVTYPDVEHLMVDHILDLVDTYSDQYDAEGLTVDVGVPSDRPVDGPPHLQVEWDGSIDTDHPVADHATVRVVAWSNSTTEAKRLANLTRGLLLGTAVPEGVASIRRLTGVLAARDPETRSELAGFTVRVSVRSTPIPVP